MIWITIGSIFQYLAGHSFISIHLFIPSTNRRICTPLSAASCSECISPVRIVDSPGSSDNFFSLIKSTVSLRVASVIYISLSYYTGAPHGAAYGLLKDWRSIMASHIPARTKFDNLLLTGEELVTLPEEREYFNSPSVYRGSTPKGGGSLKNTFLDNPFSITRV